MDKFTWKEVTEDRYNDMLNVIPPLAWVSKGFLVGEAWTHKICSINHRMSSAFQAMVRSNGQYYECLEPMTVAEWREVHSSEVVRSAKPINS